MAVISLLFVFIFIQLKRDIFALWMLLLAVGFIIPVLQAFAPAPIPIGKAQASIKILQFNILFKNNDFAKSIPWIIKQNADIVVLQEVNESRAAELDELKKHYKWSRVKTNNRREAFGMAIFSNVPVNKFDYIAINDGWNNYTRTELLISNIKLNLYELHTTPPVSKHFYEQRNIGMSLLADTLREDKTPHRLLLGDLNSTIYSPNFQNIITQADLHHAQQGYNMEGSWPSMLPSFLRIGIDQMLASKQIKIESRVIAPYKGSDHLPVITNVTLYEDL
jgi:endonuclease/exonuclease/phosphatase (EEP) superfamily protein YafD